MSAASIRFAQRSARTGSTRQSTTIAIGISVITAASSRKPDSYIHGYQRQRAHISLGDDEDPAEPAREVLEAAQEAFPALVRVAVEYADEPFDDDAAFDLDLGFILDGLQRLLEQGRSSRPARPAP